MAEPFLDNWITQIRRGLLELCILNALTKEHVYGYDVVRQLREIKYMVIGEGTIYPILSRLKREGLVTTTLEESPEGPARKYYTLTARGREVLSEMNRIWQHVLDGVLQIQTVKGDETK